MKVTTSAPGKLMLTGSYAVVHGRPCVVTAVDQRVFVTVESIDQANLILEAPDIKLPKYQKPLAKLGQGELPKAVRFAETMLKIFLAKHPQTGGVRVTTKSDFSSQVGFGSSSAVTVALVKALVNLFNLELSNKQMFDLCYGAIIEVQGVGSGFDIASAIWGGTIFYVSPAKIVKKVDVTNLPILVGYTGVKADTPSMVKRVNAMLENEPSKINLIFDGIGQTAKDSLSALKNKDWPKLGQAFNQHHQLTSRLGVSCSELDKLTSVAKQAGAYGATLSGAGGGDCMLAVVSHKNKDLVAKALERAGGQHISVKLNAQGTRVELS